MNPPTESPGPGGLPAAPPRRAVRVVAWLLGAVLLALLVELAATLYAFTAYGTVSLARLHELERNNAFVADLLRASPQTTFQQSLFPHPYLGFVRRRSGANNIGLPARRDMPLAKTAGEFRILVLGSSVASQFAGQYPGATCYLEDLLNARYDFGGARAVVLQGATGGWKMPQEAIMLLLYADVVDAVVSIEGFNEHYQMVRGDFLLEMPAGNFNAVNPVLAHGAEKLGEAALDERLYLISRTGWLTTRSHAAYFAFRAARHWLERPVAAAPATAAGDTVEAYFSFPPGVPEPARVARNQAKYADYLASMHAIARAHGLKDAYFLEPVPAIAKTLTPAERRVVGNLGYGPVYQRMVDSVLAQTSGRAPVFSLLDLYQHETGDIYADVIHCLQQGPRRESRGYQLMAERMADVLEREWQLKRKAP